MTLKISLILFGIVYIALLATIFAFVGYQDENISPDR